MGFNGSEHLDGIRNIEIKVKRGLRSPLKTACHFTGTREGQWLHLRLNLTKPVWWLLDQPPLVFCAFLFSDGLLGLHTHLLPCFVTKP